MKKTVRALSAAIGLATSSATVGYLLTGIWIGALLALVWGGLWVMGILRQARQINAEDSAGDPQVRNPEISTGAASTALMGYVVLVVGGVYYGVWPGWLLVGLVAALAGWDMEFFASRLRYVRQPAMVDALTETHLHRLGWVLAASLLLGGIALTLRYQFTFGVALLVALLVIYFMTRFIGLFRQIRS